MGASGHRRRGHLLPAVVPAALAGRVRVGPPLRRLLGTALATTVSTLGAWLHFLQARTLLSGYSPALLRRSGFAGKKISPGKVFSIIFFLRAFPLSNFIATNLLAGALRMKIGNYLLATFFGMIPSTVMYAAWGKR